MNLHLAVKAQYFDEMAEGRKPYEYRLVNNYWAKRLHARRYDRLIITKGYPKRSDKTRRLELPYKGYEIHTITHPEFGPNAVEVFAIRIVGASNVQL